MKRSVKYAQVFAINDTAEGLRAALDRLDWRCAREASTEAAVVFPRDAAEWATVSAMTAVLSHFGVDDDYVQKRLMPLVWAHHAMIRSARDEEAK